MKHVQIFWHRRDLRITDNAGLYAALKSGIPVLPLFIFDEQILSKLGDKQDPRLSFIHQSLMDMRQELATYGSSMKIAYGDPMEVWKTLTQEYKIEAVYTNRDYEPYALQRDQKVADFLGKHGVGFHDFKDHVIFEKDEVVKGDGGAYTVFTPYSRKWKAKLEMDIRLENGKKVSYYLQSYPTEKYFSNLIQTPELPIPSLEDMGFSPTMIPLPGPEVSQGLIRNYEEKRNFPAQDATSKLGIHFRFGTISIRAKARKAQALSATFLSELIWRDFYSQILYNYPHVATEPFRAKYDHIVWRNNEEDFKRWCEGTTGYPLVDAGMRELNTTGFMHNRVRMVTASFLTKHLLIDWRWGEAYFAEKLLDFDLASNNGGWQWAAGTGTDAAPYFRIFNPTSQMEKFDKQKKYILHWVPEYGTPVYPHPMVDHPYARQRCLEVYKAGLAMSDLTKT